MQSKSFSRHMSTVMLLLAALQISIFIGMDNDLSCETGAALALGRDGSSGIQGGAAGGENIPEVPQRNLSAPVLVALARDYKDSPDDVTWGKYFTYLRDLLVRADFSQANPADVIAANPTLSDLHVKVNDVGAKDMHLWSFPSIVENHAVIFASPGKTTAIPLPLSIVLREGHIIPTSFAPAARAETTRVIAKGKGKNGIRSGRLVKRARTVSGHRPGPGTGSVPVTAAGTSQAFSAFGKYLVLLGGDRQTNTLWLKGFKLGEGVLTEAPELFAALPLFFAQNVSGKASFSGSDIVLTIQPPSGPAMVKDADEKPETIIQSNGKPVPVKPTNAVVAGYKVVLKYMGGKFALAGRLPDDAPLSVALAFAQNICSGHSDLAKAWLSDPKLVSIPKYLGLIGRTTPTMRLVAMSGTSGARYRLITSAKDDLIIDVGRIAAPGRLKGQLAIRGLFIAPPDPYAAGLGGTPVLPAPVAEASEKVGAEGAGTIPSLKSADRQGNPKAR